MDVCQHFSRCEVFFSHIHTLYKYANWMGFNTLFYMKCGRKETYYNIIAIF